MIVVVHKAISMTDPFELFDDFREKIKKIHTVRIVQKYFVPGVAPGCDVV